MNAHQRTLSRQGRGVPKPMGLPERLSCRPNIQQLAATVFHA